MLLLVSEGFADVAELENVIKEIKTEVEQKVSG